MHFYKHIAHWLKLKEGHYANPVNPVRLLMTTGYRFQDGRNSRISGAPTSHFISESLKPDRVRTLNNELHHCRWNDEMFCCCCFSCTKCSFNGTEFSCTVRIRVKSLISHQHRQPKDFFGDDRPSESEKVAGNLKFWGASGCSHFDPFWPTYIRN